MITDYLFLSPGGDILCDPETIRLYVEQHYGDRRPCSHCGCYLIPTGKTHRLLFRIYRCANEICSVSLKAFKLQLLSLRRA